MLAKLSAQNRFALAFRTHNMKTAGCDLPARAQDLLQENQWTSPRAIDRVEVEHHDAQLDVAALWIASLRSQ